MASTAAAPGDLDLRSTVFGGLRIEYDASMLAPRGWTLAQSRWAAELLPDLPAGPVLELCAGAGHLGLVAVHALRRPLVAVEVNPRACRLLRGNAARAGLADLVEVREGRIDEVVGTDERFALVIADPPWVPHARVPEFPADPVGTIDGGADGLDVARDCLAVIAAHLRPGGSAILQVGSTGQVDALSDELPPRLAVVETRAHGTRGVLARLDAG
jgi:methylase of polypeptide subunit release factors